ncbi:MAG: biotin--[acetyl-CoA-carboxylase] ligase [Prevotellaceae bacterium]|jgi:BirA family biotin operon repressor/biotin-[acetyl-CoA-carboxylase] ligase|nr:biotin--[acetyl-CoA-carboxylase] ligase [Prevotellaceae bacterium]
MNERPLPDAPHTENTTTIRWIPEIDSTNRYAASHAADAPEGSVWAARVQTAGRGQQNNKWESEPHKNITCSLLLRPDWLPAEAQFYISKIVALGIARFLQRYRIEPAIKWPNDMYVAHRKIAGVLIEHQIAGHSIATTIVGVGLNVNQKRFLSDAPNPTSMCLETGQTFDLQQILPELIDCILNPYERLRLGDLQSIDDDYRSLLYRRNEWHWFETDAKRFRAKITGVRHTGELLLQNEQGQTETFLFKEVRFID